MGMILTLYLISANVYNSVEAPSGRGFSPIEVWMLGTQIPILLALFEYGFVLYLKKIDIKTKNNSVTKKKCFGAIVKIGVFERCCKGNRKTTVRPGSLKFRRTKTPLPIEGNGIIQEMMDFKESKIDFDNQIKKLDFATMIFSFFGFTIFVFLYWTILYE